ncbi:hypothetical protein GINT2_001231 [Glugoides intestinalis]
MQEKSIIIIGDTPAIYVCAIYLFTANIKPLVIRKDMGLDYVCTYTPGLEATKEEYNQKCYEQAKSMGVEILDCKSIKVSKNKAAFTVDDGNKTFNADILVTDCGLDGISCENDSDNIFVVANKLLEKEAIVIAGIGCEIAFKIKEIIQ